MPVSENWFVKVKSVFGGNTSILGQYVAVMVVINQVMGPGIDDAGQLYTPIAAKGLSSIYRKFRLDDNKESQGF